MCKYIYYKDVDLPTYGLIVLFDLFICFLISYFILKAKKIDLKIFYLELLVSAVFAVAGAKCLAILTYCVNKRKLVISTSIIKESGYMYYGGLLGFLLAFLILSRIKNNYIKQYELNLLFLLPFMHSIWKIACFYGGCCYGIPYKGNFSVVFPNGVNGLSGETVFPVQILETIVSFLISIIIFLLIKNNITNNPFALYFLLYGITRFMIEFLRYHDGGKILSLNHLYSAICIALSILYLRKNKHLEKDNE